MAIPNYGATVSVAVSSPLLFSVLTQVSEWTCVCVCGKYIINGCSIQVPGHNIKTAFGLISFANVCHACYQPPSLWWPMYSIYAGNKRNKHWRKFPTSAFIGESFQQSSCTQNDALNYAVYPLLPTNWLFSGVDPNCHTRCNSFTDTGIINLANAQQYCLQFFCVQTSLDPRPSLSLL